MPKGNFLSIKRQYMSCPVRIYVIEITYILTGHFSSISFPPVLLKREFIHFLSLIPFPEVFAHLLLCEFHYGILRDAMDVTRLPKASLSRICTNTCCVCALACVRPYTDRVASIAAAGFHFTSKSFSPAGRK